MKKRVTLPSLQEITRNTVAAFTNSFEGNPTMGAASSSVATETLSPNEAADLLQTALETRLDGPALSQNKQWDIPRKLLRILPPMNKWFFIYGLIDCAIQLAQSIGPTRVADGLRSALQRLACESDDEYFQWKAVCHE